MIIQIESSKCRVVVVTGRSRLVDDGEPEEFVALGGDFPPAGSDADEPDSGSCCPPLERFGFAGRGAV